MGDQILLRWKDLFGFWVKSFLMQKMQWNSFQSPKNSIKFQSKAIESAKLKLSKSITNSREVFDAISNQYSPIYHFSISMWNI